MRTDFLIDQRVGSSIYRLKGQAAQHDRQVHFDRVVLVVVDRLRLEVALGHSERVLSAVRNGNPATGAIHNYVR